jgi:hypothetical protein
MSNQEGVEGVTVANVGSKEGVLCEKWRWQTARTKTAMKVLQFPVDRNWSAFATPGTARIFLGHCASL